MFLEKKLDSPGAGGAGLLSAGSYGEKRRSAAVPDGLSGAAAVPLASSGTSQGILLEDIGLTYGRGAEARQVLQAVNLQLTPGEFVTVLGPSGCGKTSLLNIIAGYVKPSQGSIAINGKRHTRPDSEVGVVFQQANLFPWLTLARNIEFGLRMKNQPKAERRERVAYFLELMGLSASAGLYPHQLSGGMKQRAAIARTLAAEPEIVLLDEPFSALDALTRENMQLHLREIWRKTGKCMFFITHDVDEALLLSSRLIVMHPGPGRIVEDFVNPLTGVDGRRSFNDTRSSGDYSSLREHLVSRMESQ